MRGRVARVLELSEAELAAWRALASEAAEPNPMLEPACLLPAARLLPDGAEIYLAIAEEGGVFFGCFPFERARRGRDRMPLTLLEHVRRTVTTQVRRNRYDLTPLLRRERAGEAMGALFDAVHEARLPRAPRLLRFEALSAGGPVEAALREAAAAQRVPLYAAATWERPVAYRRPEADYARRSASQRKHARELDRKKKRLGEQLGGEVTLVDRSADPGAIDEVFRLEATGYKLATGVAFESWSGETDWFREMCDAFRGEGRLVVCSLEAAGTTVAIVVLVRGGDRLLGLQRAYDERLSHFSPGAQLDLSFFEYFHRLDGVEMQDSCTGANNFRSVPLFDEARPVVTIVAAVGGSMDRWLLLGFGRLRDRLRLRERVLQLMATHAWLDRTVRRAAARLAPRAPSSSAP